MSRAAITLGSNLGDRLGHLRMAVGRLGGLGTVIAVSSLYETAPMGGPDQGPYLNAVVVLETELDPNGLLEAAHQIENEAGRLRQQRWGPRTLDLDIVAISGQGGSQIVDSPTLTVPHPRAHERRFVVEPLVEVWPDAPLVTGAARSAVASVSDQDVEQLGREWLTDPSPVVSGALVAAQMAGLVGFAILAIRTARPPSPGRLITATIATAGGAALALAGARSLGPALTPLPEPRRGGAAVTDGPYGVIRHPIYAGLLLAMAAIAWGASSLLAGLWAGVLAVFFHRKAGYEERRLRIVVPGYATYMRRVTGRFLPGLRREVRAGSP